MFTDIPYLCGNNLSVKPIRLFFITKRKTMNISFAIPTRNNLKYLKWAYEAIRKNQGDHTVWVCLGLDACSDNTKEWVDEIIKVDPYVKYIEHTGAERIGLTVMYNRIVEELVETDIAMIYHSDMYLCPGALDSVRDLMYSSPYKKRIVSLTRIEPPLHPAGAEKITRDFGNEPEDFNEEALLKDLENHPLYIRHKTTSGVFAPWAFWVDEFKEIGGHDFLFKPTSKEDSDIFNRFKLNGIEFVQTWRGFVYHLTCRGSRFNPNITTVGVNSQEWLDQNSASHRNFIRKWGSTVLHDEYLHPIIPSKYNISFVLNNATYQLLGLLEPHCRYIYVNDLPQQVIDKYISDEQKKTLYSLSERIGFPSTYVDSDVVVIIDGNRLRPYDYDEVICKLPMILDSQEIEPGEFNIEGSSLKITIKHKPIPIPHQVYVDNKKEGLRV